MNPKGLSAAPLRAEISFRKFHRNKIDQVFDYMALAYRERLPVFEQLQNSTNSLSPFIEIGAETGANSLALVNGLGANGAACDISPDSLISMEKYAPGLGAGKLPSRIVLDCRRLPFLNHSLPFIMAWGTIHHFDEPQKALSEIRRVLNPEGCFYFDGEPVKRRMSLNLWTTRAYPNMQGLEKWLLENGLLPWFAAIDGAESIASGVIEDKPSLATWRALMEPLFTVQWRYYPYITAMIPSARKIARKVISHLYPGREDEKTVDLFGGSIGGVCKVESPILAQIDAVTELEDAFACPDCLRITDGCTPDRCAQRCVSVCPENAITQQTPFALDSEKCSGCQDCIDACPSSAIDRVPLVVSDQKEVTCPECKKVFLEKEGVLYLLSEQMTEKLSDLL